MVKLDTLTDIYNRWGDKEKLQPLGSADEELFANQDLTSTQRNWLKRFIEVWEYAQGKDYAEWASRNA